MTLQSLIRQYKHLKDTGQLSRDDNLPSRRTLSGVGMTPTTKNYRINVSYKVRGRNIIIEIIHDSVVDYNPNLQKFFIYSKPIKK